MIKNFFPKQRDDRRTPTPSKLRPGRKTMKTMKTSKLATLVLSVRGQ